MSYQDRWERGRVVETGDRECESRWAAIREVLAEYDRQVTVLEIGADLGYFSLRAAEEFDCVAVAVDGGAQLQESFARNDLDGTIALRCRLTVEDLLALGSCEHFDVVLALNVLHHFPVPGTAFNAILALGDRTIIETPPPDDRAACGQRVIAALDEMIAMREPLHEIARTPSHTTAGLDRSMVLLETPKVQITRSYIDVPDFVPLGPVFIDSTLHSKRVRFGRKNEEREWIAGINVQTYRKLGGGYPEPERVASMISEQPLPEKRHGDIRPWNYILTGPDVHLIDGGDDRAIYDDAEGRAQSATMVAQGGGA